MAFSIHLNKDEKELVSSYALMHAMSIGEAFKKALFEKIEDEYDTIAGEKAHSEYVKSGKKSRPAKEFFKELNL